MAALSHISRTGSLPAAHGLLDGENRDYFHHGFLGSCCSKLSESHEALLRTWSSFSPVQTRALSLGDWKDVLTAT